MTDEELLQRLQAGDSRAFDTLFERHAAAIQRYLTRLTRNSAVADDLTQQTFLSVLRGRDRFLPGARFKPWLYAIATNAARDSRRRTRLEELSEAGTLPEGEPVQPQVKDAGLERQVRAALEKLPQAMREAIILHRFEGLSFAEIAQASGVSESAVKVRAHRGYQKLKALLGEVWDP